MTDRVKQTAEFLERELEHSEYLRTRPEQLMYRIQHSYRVSNIGRTIALAEGLDSEALVIACLLHDVAYRETFKSNEDSVNHGRLSARIARPFLQTLGLSEAQIQEICYGIAIHVDDEADFYGERTAFALTVGDADNLDRLDAYRIHESLLRNKYTELGGQERAEYLQKALKQTAYLKTIELATPTANRMWQQRLALREEFYTQLKEQLDNSYSVLL